MSMSAAAIILAAGASRRLGRPKQLLEYCGETLLERAIRLAHESGASPVLAVLGAHFEVIRASISLDETVLVQNQLWEQGIANSIHAGLRALDASAPHSSGALLMSCDQPRLTSKHLRLLLDAFDAQGASTIAASAYAGILGVPAVFPRSLFTELLALRGDKGARVLLAHPTCGVVTVEFTGGEVDIDLPADLAHLQ
jgi:molybdenum cofactor cytidylyltransferase